MNADGTVFCPHCGGAFKPRKDGTLRAHKRFAPWGKYGNGMPAFVRCEGTGRAPSPTGTTLRLDP